MIYLLYSLALAAGMLFTLPYWIYKILRHGKYRAGLLDRLGRVPTRLGEPNSAEQVIWIHAVSVGEVIAIAGLVAEMRRNFPGHRVCVSTTTDTGQQLARKRFGEGNVFYFPLDFAFAIRPYLEALRPEVVVLAETEFWPNFIRLAHARGARIAVVNARISDRSWPSYKRFQWVWRRVLAQVDMFLAQTEEDRIRLQSIGAEGSRVQVTGNLKFDGNVPSPSAIIENLRAGFAAEGAGPVFVCGSTVEGEESPLLRVFGTVKAAHPGAVMILAPRHPERFDEVANLLEESSLPWRRRSEFHGEALAGGVLLLDSIGELAAIYALADVAFVGGSLVPRGGHNIIEPAQHGVAILVGNHTENFRDIISLFKSQDAVRISDLATLPATVLELLAHDSERRALGRRAADTIRSQTGATLRTLAALESLLANHPRPDPVSAQAAHTD